MIICPKKKKRRRKGTVCKISVFKTKSRVVRLKVESVRTQEPQKIVYKMCSFGTSQEVHPPPASPLPGSTSRVCITG